MLLNCHTYFSFCYGTFSVEQLLDEVQQNGYSCFALTDINNTSACLDTLRLLSQEDKQWNIKPVIGIDFRNGTQQQYVGLAINNDGFRELNEHLSEHLHNKLPFNNIAPEFNNAYIIYPFNKYKGWALRENEFIGVREKDLKNLAISPYKNLFNKLVALQTVSFKTKSHFNAHRLLRAVDTNNLLSKLPESEQASETDTIIPKRNLLEKYKEFPGIITNSNLLLNRCNVSFEFGKLSHKNKKYFTDSTANDIELLKRECYEGLRYRYKNLSPHIMARVQKELEVIEKMNFASYFLINWDITRYARNKNYYYVGRGSGANSILAYLLRITDVDPIQLDLYFERFINEYRTNAPDFDIDFSWTDRDDMTDYIFKTYGTDKKRGTKHAALLGTYATFQKDAIRRELGKVFGLPAAEIDKLQKIDDPKHADHLGKLVLKYGNIINGFPSHLSIHASGIIISEEPITTYTATNLPPKGYPTTQFSMLEAEDIGLFKFDILSQRGLGKIKDSLQIIKENKGVDIDIHDIEKFTSDEKVKSLLRVGKTIGCFYVESPAMRMLLAKLQADDYLRLVAASSIIRPGVAKSGMMREYILRFRNPHLRKQAEEKLPILYDLLKETYGVMVYQEDVIKVAHIFAGLSLAEADYLRRGMSWKFKQRNEFNRVQENFFANCEAKGYPFQLVHEIWTQIESFANFAFSKGHSASYAVESYQALYLKAYFPIEYMVATLNNGGGFYRKELYIHEARLHGAEIKMPCINNSTEESVIKGNIVYLGLEGVNELEKKTVADIVEERKKNGPYEDMNDLIKRVPVSLEQMRILIRAGTFNFTGRNKKELLWEIHTLINPGKKREPVNELFEIKPKKWQLPKLTNGKLDEAFDELELLGYSLCSPFALLKDELPSKLTAGELLQHVNKNVSIVGYMVNVKTTYTSKGERMNFGTFLDLEGLWIDTVHFPPSAKAFPFTGPGCYLLKGKVTAEYDFTSLEVHEMKRLAIVDRENMRDDPVKTDLIANTVP